MRQLLATIWSRRECTGCLRDKLETGSDGEANVMDFVDEEFIETGSQ